MDSRTLGQMDCNRASTQSVASAANLFGAVTATACWPNMVKPLSKLPLDRWMNMSFVTAMQVNQPEKDTTFLLDSKVKRLLLYSHFYLDFIS